MMTTIGPGQRRTTWKLNQRFDLVFGAGNRHDRDEVADGDVLRPGLNFLAVALPIRRLRRVAEAGGRRAGGRLRAARLRARQSP